MYVKIHVACYSLVSFLFKMSFFFFFEKEYIGQKSPFFKDNNVIIRN